MTHTRKKLLLREDEAEMIEFALTELTKRLEQAEKEHSAMEIFTFSAAEKAACKAAAEKARNVIAETKRILKLVQDAEVEETGGGSVTPAETVKALREDCKTCGEGWNCENGLNPLGLYCAVKDAADLIERLEKEKAALLEYAKKSAGCEQCANYRTRCEAVDCNQCAEGCPCQTCKRGSKWEWKGLEDSNGTMHNQT